jgi:hypothetical protein
MAFIHPSSTDALLGELRGQLDRFGKSLAAFSAPAVADDGAELREKAAEHFQHAGIASDHQTSSAYLALAIGEEASARLADSSSAPAAPLLLKSAAARAAMDQADELREAALLLRARADLAPFDSAVKLQLLREAVDADTRALMLERSAAG